MNEFSYDNVARNKKYEKLDTKHKKLNNGCFRLRTIPQTLVSKYLKCYIIFNPMF